MEDTTFNIYRRTDDLIIEVHVEDEVVDSLPFSGEPLECILFVYQLGKNKNKKLTQVWNV